jgi:predicted CXXCH cytochrome family protein
MSLRNLHLLVAAACIGALPLAGLRAAPAPAAQAPAPAKRVPNEDCMDCHESLPPGHARDPDAVPNPAIEVIRAGAFTASVHGKLMCVDCHATVSSVPHDDKLPPAQCASCHAKESEAYARSIHGMSHAMGASAAATCVSCHGNAHEIVPVKQLDSPVFKLNLPQTCATCHSDPKLIAAYRLNPHTADYYKDSIHGQALVKMRLIVAPSCDDCHGVHDIKRNVDQSARTNHANIAKTCGQCHLGIEATYNQSVHGQLLAKGDPKGPVCTDCHSAHQIKAPAGQSFKAASDEVCGKCHEDRLLHYRETYHGKAMALGRPNVASDVAACYDCHGHHDVFPVSDPRSHLSKGRVLGTCQQCHPGVGPRFTLFQPHADPRDASHYPSLHAVYVGMTALLVGVFAFFGLHTLLWVVRSVYLYLNDTKTFREAKVRANVDDEVYTRFTVFERFLHLLVVTSFLLLVLTGMPLKFYYTGWAQFIFGILGGAEVARALHRFGAIITFTYFGLHLFDLVASLWRNRAGVRDPATGRLSLRRAWGAMFGPDSMVPSFQDWRDFVDHQRWFFGKGVRPQFDRWTYWERFDYFAVFWGIFIIGSSGLVMWFPGFFTRFLPGWLINIALLLHSDEALLAAGFIFTFHFFNTHFRIEKFPMDTVIFSGRISKTELLHERRRWYDRLVAAGKLDEHKVRDSWESSKRIARSFGFLFFGLGLVLLGLILYAMVSRLSH